MAGGRKLDRTGSGVIWFLMLAVVIFALYSVAVAVKGVNDCGDGPKTWQLFPPEWKCEGTPGFG